MLEAPVPMIRSAMPKYIALLRSVNVAGHGRLSHAGRVNESFLALGHKDVSTYIQTGNVLFRSPSKSASRLVAGIEGRWKQDFGSSPAVILRTAAELQHVVATSPYPDRGADPARHHVTFLAEKPSKEHLSAFSPRRADATNW